MLSVTYCICSGRGSVLYAFLAELVSDSVTSLSCHVALPLGNGNWKSDGLLD